MMGRAEFLKAFTGLPFVGPLLERLGEPEPTPRKVAPVAPSERWTLDLTVDVEPPVLEVMERAWQGDEPVTIMVGDVTRMRARMLQYQHEFSLDQPPQIHATFLVDDVDAVSVPDPEAVITLPGWEHFG